MPHRATHRAEAQPGPPDDGSPIAEAGSNEIPLPDQPSLAQGEELLVALRGIGAVLFLTTERVVVVRDGRERRPRSGTQSFPLDSISHLRIELGTGPSGRIAVSTGGQEVVSIFFDASSADRAQEAIDRVRPLIARRRRARESASERSGN